MAALNRQDLMRRAQALIERRRPAVAAARPHWWSNEADAEFEAFRAGGPLPTSAEALELLEIHIWLDENV